MVVHYLMIGVHWMDIWLSGGSTLLLMIGVHWMDIWLSGGSTLLLRKYQEMF